MDILIAICSMGNTSPQKSGAQRGKTTVPTSYSNSLVGGDENQAGPLPQAAGKEEGEEVGAAQ